VSDFTKLKVWVKAHAMAVHAHRVATAVRPGHLGSLRNQLVRAAMSIPTNIVEGSGQRSSREFARFLRIAVNSARELEYHLMLADEIGAIPEQDFVALRSQVIEVRKMLHGFIKRLDQSETDPVA
jgi:four helix bundle protein